MSQALYRKYRSKNLDEIVGQDHVTMVLRRALEKDRVAHAYLLTGPRGVGKTSIARIMAHEINDLPYTDETSHLDIIEIDAASNTSVDDVRDLRDKARIAPVSAKRKIYIIDEVHMLSKAAFNALLKILEEPPEHIVFILATTDVDKLPPTIISRTQQFHFRAIQADEASKHLREIAKAENIKISDDALSMIAERGAGSFRDSISTLDQIASLAGDEEITAQLVEEVLGLTPQATVRQLVSAYEAGDTSGIISLIDQLERQGTQIKLLVRQLISSLRFIVGDKPQLICLLDDLLEVEKSPRQEIKLLTVMTKPHVTPIKPKTAALKVEPAVIAQPIPSLEKKAIQANPKEKVSAPKANPTPRPNPKSRQPEPVVSAGTEDVDAENFNWDGVVEHARQNFVAIYSVVSKCSYEITDNKLIIYAVNAFYKKKLDDPRHRVNLYHCLKANGIGDITIETIGTPPPPKDSKMAAIAAMMGGGEEVSLDESPA